MPLQRASAIRPRFRTAALLVALAAATALAQIPKPAALPPAERRAALDAAKITFDDALLRADETVTNGLAFRVELSTHSDAPAYFVQLLVGDPTHYLVIDADAGTVLDQRDGQFNKDVGPLRLLLGQPNVGLVTAMQLAEAEFPNHKAYSVEAVLRGQELQFEIHLAGAASDELHVWLNPAGDVIRSSPPPARTKK